jgi:phage-related protein
MPIVLPPTFAQEFERPQPSNPMVWFLELELAKPLADDVPGVILRVCDWHEQLQWPLGSPDDETWYPFPFAFTEIDQNQEGDLPQLGLSVDNTARTLMRFLHEGDGLEGNRALLHAVPSIALGLAWPDQEAHTFELQIADAEADSESVAFRLEDVNYFDRMSPQDRYAAARCRWAYGRGECGAVVNVLAAFQRCRKTVDACNDIGQDHVNRGLPRLHPTRFGGFAGLPARR